MTKSEENQLTMIEATSSLLNANIAKLAIPALKSAVGDLNTVLSKLKEMVQQRMTATAGKAKTKANCEDSLLEELMVVAKAMVAFGRTTGDQEVIEKANVTISQLRYLRDTELVAKSRTIHELASEKLVALADFGITSAMLESLKLRIDAFETALGERESSVARRKGARSGFYDYLDQAKSVLEDVIDNLMEQFKKSDPQFYNEYVETRTVKNVGLRHKDQPPNEPPPAE